MSIYSSRMKLTTLGGSSTGKTSLIMRLVYDRFGSTDATIGASYMTYKMDDITYEIWDTAGSERFKSLLPIYYRSSDIILLVFDLSRSDTIDDLSYYINGLSRHLNNEHRVIIVGNKSDLVNDNEISSLDVIVRGLFENRNDVVVNEVVYVSSKTGYGINQLSKIIDSKGKEMKIIKEKIERGETLEIIDVTKGDHKDYCNYSC